MILWSSCCIKPSTENGEICQSKNLKHFEKVCDYQKGPNAVWKLIKVFVNLSCVLQPKSRKISGLNFQKSRDRDQSLIPGSRDIPGSCRSLVTRRSRNDACQPLYWFDSGNGGDHEKKSFFYNGVKPRYKKVRGTFGMFWWAFLQHRMCWNKHSFKKRPQTCIKRGRGGGSKTVYNRYKKRQFFYWTHP